MEVVSTDKIPKRTIIAYDRQNRVPVYVVWEITLACNLKCIHCGSRAGDKRPAELSLSECKDVVAELAALGSREVVLIGGEAYLRKDWIEIVRSISSAGMRCAIQTGARGLSRQMLLAAKSAGLAAIGVSLDGVAETHDSMRGVAGSHSQAISCLQHASDAGLETSVNTQINRLNKNEIERIYEIVKLSGARSWQLQLTVAMGNATDVEDLIIQPYELLEIIPLLAALFERGRREGVTLVAGNNIGYFGMYEHVFRGPELALGNYEGCSAGINVLGIEADGTVKGCPSLATRRYSEGTIKSKQLSDMWRDENLFRLNKDEVAFGGYCAECYYRSVCRAGCTWTSDSLFGKPGNNPYCHHRAFELRKKGYVEVVERIEAADDKPFSTGLYRLTQRSAEFVE